MTVREVKDILDAELLCGEGLLDEEVRTGCGSDMMSDVLAFVKERSVLLTGLTNPHVVRTAEMLDVTVVVFVRGKVPTEDILEMAKERGIAICTTSHTLYVACGLLYSHGLPGGVKA